MKLYVVCFFVAMLAMAGPSHALLGAKLALLGVLKNSLGGGGYGNGYGGGYTSGYGNSGYGNSGYGNSGYGISYNRPVNTGQTSNYGWGQQSYGGGYYGYNGGSEGNVKIIKVIVSREQPDTYYDSYGRTPSAVSAPAPIPQTYLQPVQPVQVQIPVPAPAPVQSVQVSAPVPVQVVQPPTRPLYVQSQSQAGYQQVSAQRPIQYAVQSNFGQPLTTAQHVPALSYGPPVPAPNILAPSVGNSGAWNSDSWNSASSGNGLNNIGNGPWKNGGIWENIGC